MGLGVNINKVKMSIIWKCLNEEEISKPIIRSSPSARPILNKHHGCFSMILHADSSAQQLGLAEQLHGVRKGEAREKMASSH